ncbi:unnamed protein product [Pleuronectes platessa]|uniref:Uncharacterized protein n=1 Tax=Pleuronectes platessa TaxID=8262 RepID=A0A9N7UFV0_PLEPL|nr:unnamed protein product [Pleuronectes platessa]
MLWQDKFLLSYAEWERSCLGKWPVPPAERKGGTAAGMQQADTASLNVSLPSRPPPLLPPHLLPASQYLLSGFISGQEAALPPLSSHATPSLPQRQSVREKGVVGT